MLFLLIALIALIPLSALFALVRCCTMCCTVALLRWGLTYWPMVALGGAIASFFLFIDAETRIERLIGVTSGALGLVVGAAVGALLAQRLIKWPEDLKAGRGTARLVISGGDYRADRFEPDCIPVLVVDRCGAWRAAAGHRLGLR